MPLKSDIVINAARFRPEAISEKTRTLNVSLEEIGRTETKWWEVGIEKYRELRSSGISKLPLPTLLPTGRDITIPSREAGRLIPCRLLVPSTVHANGDTGPDAKVKTKGVIMHVHGGGWILNSEQTSDMLCQFYADISGCAVVTVGYRLAPEHAFPAGPEDCFDAGEWLVEHAVEEYGGPMRFLGGESAGGHLALLTTFHLLKQYPDLSLAGLLLHFGAYDLSNLPFMRNFHPPLILDYDIIQKFYECFLPGKTTEERKDPSISPFYEDLEQYRTADGSRLPKALFVCGTRDLLLDDTVLMGTKWGTAGAEQVVKIYPGGCHGFLRFPREKTEISGEALDDIKMFVEECMESV